ncbi:MAG TPA: methionyl-tRNA formyltransferase [Candidatus Saccharimonadales bacterium]|nr:methionyl-tRNA formyltransferase [Candidatus Saccharimonadales bacterium]
MFLGTPAFAVPSLDALIDLAAGGAIDLAGVVTQPDRPGHRGRITASAIARRATERGLTVLRPDRLRADGLEAVLALRPEVLVWAAYGNLIPPALLDAAGGRAVNVHASLLPRWRGAAPVAHAILAGDPETGVTLMEGTAELDAGAIVASRRTPVLPDEDAGELAARLAALGGELLRERLCAYLDGELPPRAQDAVGVTWAPKLTSADGHLDLAEPAEALARRVRAMTPSPGAWTMFRGQRLLVVRAAVSGDRGTDHGTLAAPAGQPQVAAGAGWLRLLEVKPAGKRAMAGADWIRGLSLRPGERVGS